jgi:primary-amine oxidase
LLWKHFDSHAGEAEVRRARRLVISFIATIGNYDYAFYWHLHQDGSIGHEMRLTGVISAGAVAPGDDPRCGTIVAPGVYGPNHQHFFSVRLDTMVDGLSNSVYECDSEPVPRSERNPHGGAWEVKQRRLERESEAQRLMSLERARYWRIVNERSHNQTGRPVGYRLVPGANALPLATEDCYAFGRGAFSRRHLWVTRYSPDERYAGGDFPTQAASDEGLTRWSSGDRSIADEDVVVWYTIGAHHVVRPEDWPVMPVTRIGFHLTPDGFFDGNPALDVPPPEACAHDGHHDHGAPAGDGR